MKKNMPAYLTAVGIFLSFCVPSPMQSAWEHNPKARRFGCDPSIRVRSAIRRPISITELHPLHMTGKLAIILFAASSRAEPSSAYISVQVRVRCCLVLTSVPASKGSSVPSASLIRLFYTFRQASHVSQGTLQSRTRQVSQVQFSPPTQQARGSPSGEGKRPATARLSSRGRASRPSGRACIAFCC